MRWILIAALVMAPLTGSAASPGNTEDEQQGTEQYNTVFKYNMMASLDVINKFGQALRTAAWLKECKLNTLANTIMPTTREVGEVVGEYLRKQPNSKDFLWDVWAGAMSSMNYYQIGFEASAPSIHATMGEKFCTVATQQANDLMREREAAK